MSRILDDAEGYLNSLSSEEFNELLDEMGFVYKEKNNRKKEYKMETMDNILSTTLRLNKSIELYMDNNYGISYLIIHDFNSDRIILGDEIPEIKKLLDDLMLDDTISCKSIKNNEVKIIETYRYIGKYYACRLEQLDVLNVYESIKHSLINSPKQIIIRFPYTAIDNKEDSVDDKKFATFCNKLYDQTMKCNNGSLSKELSDKGYKVSAYTDDIGYSISFTTDEFKPHVSIAASNISLKFLKIL